MIVTEELRQALDQEPGVACVLDLDGTIVHCNKNWDSAVPAGTTGPVHSSEVFGQYWIGAIQGSTRSYYEVLLRNAFSLPAKPGAGLVHVSECNTPSLIRRCTARFSPLFLEEGGPLLGVSVTYGLLALGSADAHYGMSVRPPDDFRDSSGMLIQCSCCRRLQRPADSIWDFVAEALGPGIPRVSHGICPTCLAVYYPLVAS